MTDQDREAFEEWRLNNPSRRYGNSVSDHMIVRMEDAWLAALAYARKQQAELVEAVEKMQQGGCISTCLSYVEEVDVDEWLKVAALAAQLKARR